MLLHHQLEICLIAHVPRDITIMGPTNVLNVVINVQVALTVLHVLHVLLVRHLELQDLALAQMVILMTVSTPKL